jgi:hypothetical protein
MVWWIEPVKPNLIVCVATQCVAQFNAVAVQKRNDAVPSKIRAILATALNEDGVVLSAKLVPDDTSEHMHGQLAFVLNGQLSTRRIPAKLAFVDNVSKFALGYCFPGPRSRYVLSMPSQAHKCIQRSNHPSNGDFDTGAASNSSALHFWYVA